MKTILTALVIVGLLAGSVSTALAGDSSASAVSEATTLEKAPQGERLASNDSGFASDGFARDVMNLVTGLSHPLDDSTNLTIRAGKSLHIGLTF